jgi:hypothetical protein
MVMARSVPDDISIFVIDCPDFIDDASLEGMPSTCFASYDICSDKTERPRVSRGVLAAATNLERYMSSGTRIHYTEMLGISQRWWELS